MLTQFILLVGSLIANAFSALAGGGAGLLQFPLLLWLGLPFSLALATHKVASVALGMGAALRYLRAGLLSWRLGGLLLVAGLPGVLLGAFSVLALPETVLLVSLGLLTMWMSVYSMWQPTFGLHSRTSPLSFSQQGVGALVLLVIGILNGSLTSGTGLLVTLWLVRWYGLDYKQAVAYTLVFVGLFWNGFGGLTLAIVTDVQWSWIPILLLASAVGGYLGAHWALLKGNRLIKVAFEWVTLLTGLSLLVRVWLS